MEVRSYSPSDLPQIIEIYHDAVHVLAAPFYSPEQLAAWARPQSEATRWQERLAPLKTLVMDAEGVIAGFASYELNGHLDLLFTRPRFARKGVANRLCERVEKSLAEAGVQRIYTEASLAARAFFESRNFRVLHAEMVDCRGVELKRFAMEKQIGGNAQ
jgi:putative acetyltransferase